MFEFQSFRCRYLMKVGNIGLEFSREVWAGDVDLNVMHILLLMVMALVTKVREVNYLSRREYPKQEEKTEGRTL